MMYQIEAAEKQINVLLPKDVKMVSYSVYPLPYKGYYELYVEADDKKRYRALLSKKEFLSELTEWALPAGMTPQGAK